MLPIYAGAQQPNAVLSALVQAQDIGDDVAEIAALDDHVGHGLMRRSKRRSERCAVHSGCIGDVSESRSDEIR